MLTRQHPAVTCCLGVGGPVSRSISGNFTFNGCPARENRLSEHQPASSMNLRGVFHQP